MNSTHSQRQSKQADGDDVNALDLVVIFSARLDNIILQTSRRSLWSDEGLGRSPAQSAHPNSPNSWLCKHRKRLRLQLLLIYGRLCIFCERPRPLPRPLSRPLFNDWHLKVSNSYLVQNQPTRHILTQMSQKVQNNTPNDE